MEVEMNATDFIMVLLTASLVYLGFSFIWIGMYWGLILIWFNMKMFDYYCIWRKNEIDRT